MVKESNKNGLDTGMLLAVVVCTFVVDVFVHIVVDSAVISFDAVVMLILLILLLLLMLLLRLSG